MLSQRGELDKAIGAVCVCMSIESVHLCVTGCVYICICGVVYVCFHVCLLRIHAVLVLAMIELIFVLVSGMVLCFGFRLKIMLITHQYFSCII